MTRTRLPLPALILLAALSSAVRGEDVPVPAPAGAAAVSPASAPVTDYCANFADKASDARLAWQTENLRKLQDDVTRKISELEVRQAELQAWVDRREAMLKAAGKELVEIYAKMDPEAAAAQLAQLDSRTAVSVLRQLNPRNASAIFAAMDARRATVLARAIAEASADKPAQVGAKPKGNGT